MSAAYARVAASAGGKAQKPSGVEKISTSSVPAQPAFRSDSTIDATKQPERPTWLSSQTRQLSDRPPVLTPAEIAAQNGQNGSGQNGHLPPPVPADKHIESQIDEAASVGAHPLADEHPAERIIEVPDDRPVNPDEKS